MPAKIDLNRASAAELIALPGIGPGLVQQGPRSFELPIEPA